MFNINVKNQGTNSSFNVVLEKSFNQVKLLKQSIQEQAGISSSLQELFLFPTGEETWPEKHLKEEDHIQGSCSVALCVVQAAEQWEWDDTCTLITSDKFELSCADNSRPNSMAINKQTGAANCLTTNRVMTAGCHR